MNLDRSILDRPPDRPDELPTMFYTSDQRDAGAGATREAERGAAAASAPKKEPSARPALASDDVS